jgi:hypothetical protein
VLTDSQAQRLAACARALRPPARIVATGRGAEEAGRLLQAAAPAGVEVRVVAPDAVKEVDGPLDVLFIGPTGRYSTAVDAIERWTARVVPAGTLFVLGAFTVPSLTAALLRTVGSSPGWRYHERDADLAEYTRAGLMRGERVLDGIAQVAQLPRFGAQTLRRRLARTRSPGRSGG